VIARDHNVVLHPNAWPSCRTGSVLLNARVVTARMDDQVASGDLVDRSGAILEQSVRLRSAAIVILCHIAAGIVVDLDFEPEKTALQAGLEPTGGPSASARCLSTSGNRCNGSRKRTKYSAIAIAGIEHPELQPQVEVVERLGSIVEQRKIRRTKADHFAVEKREALPAVRYSCQSPLLEGPTVPSNNAVKPDAEAFRTAARGRTLASSRSAVRREIATPVNIGWASRDSEQRRSIDVAVRRVMNTPTR